MNIPYWLIIAVLLIVTLLAGAVYAFYLLQEKLIFAPIKLPQDYKFPFTDKYEEMNYQMEDGAVINSLLFKSKDSKGLVFYIHGNADNIRYYGDFAKVFLKEGYDVFMYDYRGFGKSSGRIKNERLLQKDNRNLYFEMLKRYDEKSIVIYGYSLGTGLAARLASKHSPKSLVLETPYFDFIDIIKFHKAYLPARLITKYFFRTNKYLQNCLCKVYAFHGTEDRRVPYYSGQKLLKSNPHIDFTTIEGGTHNDLLSTKIYKLKLKEILD